MAKVMSAIAHGWKPSKGSVAKIPKKVAVEFHAADAGHKYGKGHHAKRALHIAREHSKKAKKKAEGGAAGDDYNTPLSGPDEAKFQIWKAQKFPNDTGVDYDLRGAYQADMQPDPRNNHMGDLFKKPNHPTFSDQSQYATGNQRDRAGFWIGDEGPDQTFVPPVATKADGGEVGSFRPEGTNTPDDDDKAAAITIHPVDPNEGLTQDLTKKSPIEGMDVPGPSLSAHQDTPREKMTNWLAGPDTKSYEPRSVLANKAMNVLDWTPPMMAEQAGEDLAKGEVQNAALFAMPGVKKAKGSGEFAFSLLHAAQNPLSEYSASNPVAKKLKEQYGKDLAAASVEYGYTPEQIDNIKTYMTPGAQANFDKHYSKLAPQVQPAPWNVPEIQATKPDLKLVPPSEYQAPLEPDHPNYIANYHANQGTDIDKTLADIEAALTWNKQKQPFGVSTDKFNKDAELYPAGSSAWKDYDLLHSDASQAPLNLSESQKAAVAYWGDPAGYKAMNGVLRGSNVKDGGKATGLISEMDSAIEGSPLQQDSIMWRGLHGPHAEELKKLGEGDSFYNAGYTATTIDPRRATHYGAKDGPGIVLNYHLPEGFPALYTSHPDAGGWSQAEREYLLPHGTAFKIIGTEKIKAPTWDYTGGVKSAKQNDFIVYHVAPADKIYGAHQLDADPNAYFVPKGPKTFQPVFKPKGKDTDIEDYYAEQEKHTAGPEWEPEDEPFHDTPDIGYSAPYHAYTSGKLNKDQYLEKLQEYLKPSDWMAFRPKDVAKPEKVDFGKNNPKQLEKLGFNVHTPIYKGGNWDYSTFKPGGYPQQIFDPGKLKNAEQAFFAATNRGIAEAYHGDSNIGGAYVARAPKFYEFDWHGFFGDHHYSSGDMHTVIQQAKKMGADVVALHNMQDVGSAKHGVHTQLAFLNTNVLRAPTANFDPTKLHLRHPLAGLAGGGIFTYGALSGEPEEKKDGGKVAKKDKDPEEKDFINFSDGGLINSNIPGRTDKHPMRVKAGAYVLPGDIPSALGQGNTMAGSEILKKMFSSGPYGLAPPKIHSSKFSFPRMPKLATGGKADDDTVPIIAAGGEYVIPPEVVKEIGHGSMSAGHAVLDKFVLHTRKEHIKTLKKLPGPKK